MIRSIAGIGTLLVFVAVIHGASRGSAETHQSNEALESLHIPLVLHNEPLPLAPPTIVPTPEPFLQLEGQFGGNIWDVKLDGKYAFVAQSAQMVVLDVSEPDSPNYIGQSEVMPGRIMALAIENDLAYLAVDDPRGITDQGGLYIVDVGDPTQPSALGHLYFEGGLTNVIVMGRTAFVTVRGIPEDGQSRSTGSIQIVDIGDPNAPFRQATIRENFHESSDGMALYRQHLILSSGSVYDVSEPSSPEHVSSLDLEGFPLVDLVVERGLLYGISGNRRGRVTVSIHDVGDPSSPLSVGAIDHPRARYFSDSVGGAALLGDTLFFAGEYLKEDGIQHESHALMTLDVADPISPRWTSVTEVAAPVAALDLQDGLAALSVVTGVNDWAMEMMRHDLYGYGGGNLVLLDTSNSAGPKQAGLWTRPSGMSQGFAHDDATAFILNQRPDELVALDLARPEQPQTVGIKDLLGAERPVSVSGNGEIDIAHGGSHVWIPTEGGVMAVDVSDPRMPHTTAIISTSQGTTGSLPNFANDVLFAVEHRLQWDESIPSRLVAFDVGNLAEPRALGALDLTNGASAMRIAEDRALLIAGRRTGIGRVLQIIDLTDPENLKQVGGFEPLATEYLEPTLAVVGDIVFLLAGVDSGWRFWAVDISDPESPIVGEPIDAVDYGRGFEVIPDGEDVFVLSARGIQKIDVSSPLRPTLAGSLENPQWLRSFLGMQRRDRWFATDWGMPRVRIVNKHLYTIHPFAGASVYRIPPQ